LSSDARGSRAGAAVRALAARHVARIVAGESTLTSLYGDWQTEDVRDAALLRVLVTGTLRWHYRLAWQVGRLLTKPLPPKDAELGALLRAGLFQLQWTRIPEHAAVAATVEAAAGIGRRHAKGLVNAVMRRFQRERSLLEQAMVDDDQAYFSHPQWLIDRLRADWPERADAVLAAGNIQAPMWLRVNTQRTSVDAYAAELDAAGIAYERAADLPQAIVLAEPRPAAKLPGFAEGRVSIQDGAAQRAAEYLDLAPGQRVLDACAAPGGKTAHILERGGASLAEVVALDADEGRLLTLRANLDRLGLSATVICGEAEATELWWDGHGFDRVLLDAPCTATGVIRRHPDIKVLRTPDELEHAVAVQRELLDRLWNLVEPGGRLVYATCSVLRAENDDQIDRFLSRHANAACTFRYQYFPGEANMDGFYYACLTRGE
jgi:16S rRNA (cytosine967-C5)-methyltransferase